MAKKRKLNYRFHNPNPTDVCADYILTLFMEVNQTKVEQAIQSALKQDRKMANEDLA